MPRSARIVPLVLLALLVAPVSRTSAFIPARPLLDSGPRLFTELERTDTGFVGSLNSNPYGGSYSYGADCNNFIDTDEETGYVDIVVYPPDLYARSGYSPETVTWETSIYQLAPDNTRIQIGDSVQQSASATSSSPSGRADLTDVTFEALPQGPEYIVVNRAIWSDPDGGGVKTAGEVK